MVSGSVGPANADSDPGGKRVRLILRATGNLLIAGSTVAALALGAMILLPELSPSVAPAPAGSGAQAVLIGRRPSLAGRDGATTRTAADPLKNADPNTATLQAGAAQRPITHLDIPAIDLTADVVPAALVERDGGLTWEVPAFKVGHAESTAGAGQLGNAILLGHVTSVRSGNVFQDLDKVNMGDVVHIVSDATSFDYAVVSTRHIPRSDSSVLEQGDTPAVSLITCTGVWLPTIWDYTERLVVRAELVHTR